MDLFQKVEDSKTFSANTKKTVPYTFDDLLYPFLF